LSWYFFILVFRYAWGTLNALPPGQSKQGKA